MQPELHAWASSYTDDPNLAYALVHYTILKSSNVLNRPVPAVTTRAWLAGLMWRTVSTMECFEDMRHSAGMRPN